MLHITDFYFISKLNIPDSFHSFHWVWTYDIPIPTEAAARVSGLVREEVVGERIMLTILLELLTKPTSWR